MKMTTYEIWNLIIQGAVGVGTLLVAAIAIWGNLVRSWWSGPKLRLRLHNPMGINAHRLDASEVLPSKSNQWS